MKSSITLKQYHALHGGDMVPLGCRNHPGLVWATKKLATEIRADEIKPNGRRSVFYASHREKECECTLGDLFVNIVEDETPKAQTHVFTLVYLASNRHPRQSRKIEIEAENPHAALSIFVNMPEHQNDWVAAIVQGVSDIVHGTL